MVFPSRNPKISHNLHHQISSNYFQSTLTELVLIKRNLSLKNFSEVDHVHFFGYYIGNYPSLKKEKIIKICNILNNISYE